MSVNSSNSVDISIQDNNIYINNMCNAGKTALSITPDGTVYPCVSLKYPLGNILLNSISEIWNSDHRIEYISSLTWNNTKKCKKCELKEDCPHCIGISQFETGDAFECNTCDRLIAQCVQEIRNQAQKILDMIMQCNYNDKKLHELAQILNYEQDQLVSDLYALQKVFDNYKSLFQNNYTHFN